MSHPAINSIFSLTNHEVWAVSAHHRGLDNAMIATWIVPATLVYDELRLVAVLSVENYTVELLRESGRFAVQMLAEGQHELLPRLGLHSGRAKDKLAGLPLARSPGGLALLEGTCGWAECVVVNAMDSGDRLVFLADVVAQGIHPGRKPLHKRDAFERLSPGQALSLVEKALLDAQRDRKLLKRFR
ncbi:MAG: flavin reductase [Deltaproteobacteria bacterium]|nr:flavin reductase [Deltaproteobacteria bacterium]